MNDLISKLESNQEISQEDRQSILMLLRSLKSLVSSEKGIVMHPMHTSTGMGAFLSTEQFYIDIQPEQGGNLSVYFRDKTTGKEVYAETARSLVK